MLKNKKTIQWMNPFRLQTRAYLVPSCHSNLRSCAFAHRARQSPLPSAGAGAVWSVTTGWTSASSSAPSCLWAVQWVISTCLSRFLCCETTGVDSRILMRLKTKFVDFCLWIWKYNKSKFSSGLIYLTHTHTQSLLALMSRSVLPPSPELINQNFSLFVTLFWYKLKFQTIFSPFI